jgi:NAD(P)-dependent dehydrogenase (short-subunit alcohol dehydrogenase family)
MTESTGTIIAQAAGEPELLGQTVVVIGGSAGIGFETARRASLEGARVVLTGRDPKRLREAAGQVSAVSTAAFDATDPGRLQQFFDDLAQPIDHVMLTAGGSYYAPLADLDFEQVHRAFEEHIVLPMRVARDIASAVRPGGTVLYMTGTAARRPGVGMTVAAVLAAALPALVANLALEMAPVRVNLIAAGFVDTALSALSLGDDIEKRRDELRATLPIRRVVGPADVASLALHIMTNTALTGATYDVDGGQQII